MPIEICLTCKFVNVHCTEHCYKRFYIYENTFANAIENYYIAKVMFGIYVSLFCYQIQAIEIMKHKICVEKKVV